MLQLQYLNQRHKSCCVNYNNYNTSPNPSYLHTLFLTHTKKILLITILTYLFFYVNEVIAILTFKLPNSLVYKYYLHPNFQTFIEDHPDIMLKIIGYCLCFLNDYIWNTMPAIYIFHKFNFIQHCGFHVNIKHMHTLDCQV